MAPPAHHLLHLRTCNRSTMIRLAPQHYTASCMQTGQCVRNARIGTQRIERMDSRARLASRGRSIRRSVFRALYYLSRNLPLLDACARLVCPARARVARHAGSAQERNISCQHKHRGMHCVTTSLITMLITKSELVTNGAQRAISIVTHIQSR